MQAQHCGIRLSISPGPPWPNPPLVPTWSRSSPQLAFLLILQMSPFKAGAKANHGSPQSWRSRVILPTSVFQGIRDAGTGRMVAGQRLVARLAEEEGEVVQWVRRE